ncbi:MAG: hypothetical protein WBK99_06105 [Solirubrobacterales bacterium]
MRIDAGRPTLETELGRRRVQRRGGGSEVRTQSTLKHLTQG